MTDATYLDCSGSMATAGREVAAQQHASSPLFYFGKVVHDEKPSCEGPTNFASVFSHARVNGFQTIRIVTDGYAEEYGIQPTGLNVEWVKV